MAVSGAAPPAVGLPIVSEPSLKLSLVIDPSLDTLLVRLPAVRLREAFDKYFISRGAEPSEDVEPTTEQISAVAQVIAADLTPYADFAILGPHGKRMLLKM